MLASIILNTGLFIIGVGFNVDLYSVPNFPELDLDRWWGDGIKPDYIDETIKPFTIDFNDTMIDDLRSRLRNRRPFTAPMEGIQSEYGLNTDYFNNILHYWSDSYNFKERADRLNRFPHYKTRIQGLDIHFIRATPEVKGLKILPILLIHGWPSSSKEFDRAIPMLIEPRTGYDFVFDVVAVNDLPGFGFSEGTNKPGLTPVQIGIVLRNLMKRLGFSQFYIQAGDWGSQVATHMVTMFQNEILGFHTNMPMSRMPISVAKYLVVSLFPSYFVEEKNVERVSFKQVITQLIREFGYYHLQATKPDTIGAALTDTPSGIAAYILERVGAGSNADQLNTPHGGMENINIDDLLDTATIMWANERITTSMRIYAEAYAWPEVTTLHSIPTKVPTAAIKFKYEIVYQPDWILRDKFPNLVRSTELDFGGHFAGMQTPAALVDDVFASVTEFIKFQSKNVANE
ncbi:LOW QUALITY PROTEIN: juvenile hormone epoxide hydrolase-like [Aricia agestis]|uniref:LOW QUALITY PROTEIN: juvenile hormone epoxide hydrolase-like n=1 Tax=Aricia agestis TaxID=91739 RepID=UPI001C207962|nr:LOW QUALITY PROTEIN: juvenile hormone epoxide hydrolase-like [Aricia agestis]